ncbi:MAG TPA: hypothetical protein VJ822_02930, partial [Dongiaceae bacterium]|nr:hypothetical protein [Dongiaceae bacterium]
DTELQSAADAIALAGAAELDGSAGAIDRAENAMADLVQNSQTFGIGAAALTAYEPRFLSSLPASDADPITDDLVLDPLDADSDGAARFVEVRIIDADRREIDSMFATAIGGDQTTAAGATAVAGFTSAVCKFTPLFMCNPFEEDDASLAHFTEQFDTTAERRRIIALKKSGSGASYTPGNFGFLESEIGPGAKALGESLASVEPAACFRQDGVETKTGSTNSVHKAINVRFDLYANGIPGSWKSSSEFRPSTNVTKGYLQTGGGGGGGGNPCNVDLDTSSPLKAMGFPIDTAIGSNRMGNGTWDFEAYWDLNHGNRDGVYNGTTDGNTTGWDNSNLPARYDVYRWEIDNSQIPNKSTAGGENGNPRCSSAAVSDEPDRRIIYAAVINCVEHDLHGGSGDTIPALTFLKMFITQPMTKLPGTGHTDEDNTLYVEMIDIVKPGVDDEVVHDIVQLYR